MESNRGKIRILVFASGDEKGGGSGFQELSNFPKRIRLSWTLKLLVSFLTTRMEGSIKKQMLFIFLSSIGPDPLMAKVTEPLLINIRLILSCAPGG